MWLAIRVRSAPRSVHCTMGTRSFDCGPASSTFLSLSCSTHELLALKALRRAPASLMCASSVSADTTAQNPPSGQFAADRWLSQVCIHCLSLLEIVLKVQFRARFKYDRISVWCQKAQKLLVRALEAEIRQRCKCQVGSRGLEVPDTLMGGERDTRRFRPLSLDESPRQTECGVSRFDAINVIQTEGQALNSSHFTTLQSSHSKSVPLLGYFIFLQQAASAGRAAS